MKTTHGIFVVDSLGKLLVVHPTNHHKDFWSIPKGVDEEGETSLQSAIREMYEETGLDLYNVFWPTQTDLVCYAYLGKEVYISNSKKLKCHFMLFNTPLSEMRKDLHCDSMFINPKNGKEQPENDIIKWVDIEFAEKYLHEAQKKFIDNVKDLLVSLK